MKTKIVVAALAVVLAVNAFAIACTPDNKTEDTGSDTTTETIVIEVEEETAE